MPTSADPLVRAALDAFRRQVDSQVHLRRTLIQAAEAPAGCATSPFTLTVPAHAAAIPIVTDGVSGLMEEKQWPKDDVFAVQLALQEAVANAIRHGCCGDTGKHVQCSISCDASGEVVIVVRDPGPGFDPSAIADPLDAQNVLRPSGRGIFLIKALMDHVQFADGGREVRMRKRRSPGLTTRSR